MTKCNGPNTLKDRWDVQEECSFNHEDLLVPSRLFSGVCVCAMCIIMTFSAMDRDDLVETINDGVEINLLNTVYSIMFG